MPGQLMLLGNPRRGRGRARHGQIVTSRDARFDPNETDVRVSYKVHPPEPAVGVFHGEVEVTGVETMGGKRIDVSDAEAEGFKKLYDGSEENPCGGRKRKRNPQPASGYVLRGPVSVSWGGNVQDLPVSSPRFGTLKQLESVARKSRLRFVRDNTLFGGYWRNEQGQVWFIDIAEARRNPSRGNASKAWMTKYLKAWERRTGWLLNGLTAQRYSALVAQGHALHNVGFTAGRAAWMAAPMPWAVEHKRNPGAKWHMEHADEAKELARTSKLDRNKHYFQGKEAAHLESWGSSKFRRRGNPVRPWEQNPYRRADIIRTVTEPGTEGTVRWAFYDGRGRRIGRAVTARTTLGHIEVRPEFRRKGYAKQIMNQLLAKGITGGFAGSDAGAALMRSVGMVETDTGHFQVKNPRRKKRRMPAAVKLGLGAVALGALKSAGGSAAAVGIKAAGLGNPRGLPMEKAYRAFHRAGPDGALKAKVPAGWPRKMWVLGRLYRITSTAGRVVLTGGLLTCPAFGKSKLYVVGAKSHGAPAVFKAAQTEYVPQKASKLHGATYWHEHSKAHPPVVRRSAPGFYILSGKTLRVTRRGIVG